MVGDVTKEVLPARPLTDESPVPTASLTVIGSFSLRVADGQNLLIKSKRNRALLACLSVAPDQTATRERIASLLWGRHGEEQARSNLRQSLAVLRKELGTHRYLVQTRAETLALETRAIRVDAVELLACDDIGDISQLRRAARCYRGEFLADISLGDEVFDEWLSSERSRLTAAVVRLFDRLSRLETGSASIEAAQTLVKIDPLREASHRLLMHAYAKQGDNGLAIKQYELCRIVLRDELQVEPAQETQDLRREIATGSAEVRRRDDDASPVATTYPRLPDRPSIAVLPFSNMSDDPKQVYFWALRYFKWVSPVPACRR